MTIPASSLTLGPHSLTAVYSGDTYDATVTSPVFTLNIITGTDSFHATTHPTWPSPTSIGH